MLDSAFTKFLALRCIAAFGVSGSPIFVTFVCIQFGSGTSLLAQALSANVIGQLTATLLSGTLVDRMNRNTYLRTCYGFNAIVYLIYSAYLSSQSLDHRAVITLSLLLGAMSGMIGPALQSVVPLLVETKNLIKANGTLRVTTNTINVISPALTGLAISQIGLLFTATCLSVTFTLASAISFLLPQLPHAVHRSFISDLITGWRVFFTTRWFLISTTACALINVAWVAFYQTLAPIHFTRIGLGADAWGMATGVFAVGLIVGGLAFRSLKFSQPLTVSLVALSGKALPIAALFLTNNFLITTGALFIAGFLLECFVINFYAFCQKSFAQEIQGKMFAIDSFISLSFLPVGYWIGSKLGEVPSILPYSIFTAAAVICISVISAISTRSAGNQKNI